MLQVEKLLISPWLLLSILLVVAFFGWLFAVKIFSPSDRFWRATNFCALLFTCLGIFGMVKDSRQFFCEREYYQCQRYIESDYGRRLRLNFNEFLYCREFIKTEYSPSNLSTMQEDYDLTCQWINEYKDYFFECYSNQEPIVADSIIFPKLQSSNQVLEYYFDDIQQYITDYNSDIMELRSYKQGLYLNAYELYYMIFSPLLLAIGLGWEFVKFFAKY